MKKGCLRWIDTFTTMSGARFEREVFIYHDGDIARWREGVRQLSTVFVDGVKVSGNRRVTGKLSVFTNEDLVHLILLYATPRTFNYTKEDAPYTLLLNPYPFRLLEFFEGIQSFERRMSPLMAGVSNIFHYQTGRYFSKWLSTSFVAISAVDFLKYAFKSLLTGVQRGADQVDCTCSVGVVVLSFPGGQVLGEDAFQYYFFETSEDQVAHINNMLETPSFCAVFVKTTTKGWVVEHFFAHSGAWVYEGDEDVLESSVRIISNDDFRSMVAL